MARIASPELNPGAGSPWMFIAGTALYRSRRGGPYTQRPEATAENGTRSPLVLRTCRRWRSPGSMRNGASAWA